MDIHQALLHIREKIKNDSPIVAIGFSMGGNMIAKYASEIGRDNRENLLAGVLCVSQGYDGVRGVKHLNQSIYSPAVTFALKDVLKRYFTKTF